MRPRQTIRGDAARDNRAPVHCQQGKFHGLSADYEAVVGHGVESDTMRGDDGNYDIARSFFPLAFPIQPPQPNHPVPEKRAAAIMRGDDGTADPAQAHYQLAKIRLARHDSPAALAELGLALDSQADYTPALALKRSIERDSSPTGN